MTIRQCPDCGENLDPGEICDCKTAISDTSGSGMLMQIRQLPIIEEHLHRMKSDIQTRVHAAMSLD